MLEQNINYIYKSKWKIETKKSEILLLQMLLEISIGYYFHSLKETGVRSQQVLFIYMLCFC